MVGWDREINLVAGTVDTVLLTRTELCTRAVPERVSRVATDLNLLCLQPCLTHSGMSTNGE